MFSYFFIHTPYPIHGIHEMWVSFIFAERTDENVAIEINWLCIRNINPSSYRMYDSSYHHGYL